MSTILIAAIYFALPLCWWFLTARKKECFFSWIGFKKIERKKWFWFAIVFNVVISYLSPKYFTPLFMPSDIVVQSQYAGLGWAALPSILSFGLWTGFSEEFFFRGFLLGRIQSKLGFHIANIAQAAIFAAPHALLLMIAAPQLWFAACMFFILAMLGGWLYGIVTERAGGAILPAILLHGLGNIGISLLHAFNLM